MDRDERAGLIRQYGAGPDVLRGAWDACPPAARHWKPAPGDWSAHEIVAHCADSETFASTRIRLLIAEPNPVIVGYDQDAWAEVFAYASLPADLAFATIAAVRASTYHLIESIGDESWTATGTHSQAGPYTAGDWLTIYGVHLHDHADQIHANVERWHIHASHADPLPTQRSS